MKQNIKQNATKGVRWSLLSSIVTGGGYFLMLVVLARILPKEAFGVFAVANIAAGLANLSADFGFGQAIVQKQTTDSIQLSSLFWVNIFIAVFLFLLSYPLGLLLEDFYKIPNLAPSVVLVMISVIPNAFGVQFMYLLQKELRFKEISISEIFGNSCLVVSSIALALAGYTLGALAGGLIIGKTVQTLFFFFFGQSIHRPRFVCSTKALKDFWHFGSFQTGRGLLVYLIAKTDTLIIGKITGSTFLGIYEVIKDILTRPIALINPVIGRVSFPLLAQQQKDNKLFEAVFKKTLQIFNAVSAFLFVGAFFFAEFLISTVLGVDWLEYTSYLQLMSIAFFLHFSASPMGNLITARGQPKRGFYWNILNLAWTVCALIVGGFYGASGLLIALIVLNLSKQILAYWLVINPLSSITFYGFATAIYRPLIIAVFSALPYYFLSETFDDNFILNSAGVLVYLLLYLLVSSWLNPPFFNELRAFTLSWKK